MCPIAILRSRSHRPPCVFHSSSANLRTDQCAERKVPCGALITSSARQIRGLLLSNFGPISAQHPSEVIALRTGLSHPFCNNIRRPGRAKKAPRTGPASAVRTPRPSSRPQEPAQPRLNSGLLTCARDPRPNLCAESTGIGPLIFSTPRRPGGPWKAERHMFRVGRWSEKPHTRETSEVFFFYPSVRRSVVEAPTNTSRGCVRRGGRRCVLGWEWNGIYVGDRA